MLLGPFKIRSSIKVKGREKEEEKMETEGGHNAKMQSKNQKEQEKEKIEKRIERICDIKSARERKKKLTAMKGRERKRGGVITLGSMPC